MAQAIVMPKHGNTVEECILVSWAVKIGDRICSWASDLQAGTDAVGHVRGLGAMCAIEFVKAGDPNQPDAELTRAVALEALCEGVLLLTCGVRANVIRFLPPLTIDDATLDEALATVGGVIGRLTGAAAKAG